jgi:hypothetical protein
MSVQIIPITDHEEYSVNGHLVYKNHLNNWTCKQELTSNEMSAFKNYERLVINNKAFKRHTKATYKTK